MMTIDYLGVCREIHVASREKIIAVFSVRGDVYFCEMNSRRYDLMLKDFPKSLVGVYNKCSLKFIQDDIL